MFIYHTAVSLEYEIIPVVKSESVTVVVTVFCARVTSFEIFNG